MEIHSWDVCTTAHEAPDATLAFVAHHLSMGARRVWIFLDQPQPELESILASQPRCHVQTCDEAWWTQLNSPLGKGGVPPQPPLRQRANLQWALERSEADWLVHIDTDEFLASPSVPLGQRLAQHGDDIDFVFFNVVERVHLRLPDPDDVFSGVFRRPFQPIKLYSELDFDGPAKPFLDRGVTGYTSGKSAFRTGRGLTAGIHIPQDANHDRKVIDENVLVRHFDGYTAQHWLQKKLRQVKFSPNVVNHETEPRANQLREVARLQDDPDALNAFYLMIKRLNMQQRKELRERGHFVNQPLNPRAAVQTFFPGVTLDLSEHKHDAFALV